MIHNSNHRARAEAAFKKVLGDSKARQGCDGV
jgi:hypothetical protein